MAKHINRPTKKIWSKLSSQQKKDYDRLYEQFYLELKTLSEIQNSVKAHNLALLAVWYMVRSNG